jgi:hypothetical protein
MVPLRKDARGLFQGVFGLSKQMNVVRLYEIVIEIGV